jgi:hypothetical protein
MRSKWVFLSGNPRSAINMEHVTDVQFVGPADNLSAVVYLCGSFGGGETERSITLWGDDVTILKGWFTGLGYPEHAEPGIGIPFGVPRVSPLHLNRSAPSKPF